MARWFVSVDREDGVVAYDVRSQKTQDKSGNGEWCFVEADEVEQALAMASPKLGLTREKLARSGFKRGELLAARLDGHQPDCGCPACRAST